MIANCYGLRAAFLCRPQLKRKRAGAVAAFGNGLGAPRFYRARICQAIVICAKNPTAKPRVRTQGRANV
jgi:hypothetical protein